MAAPKMKLTGTDEAKGGDEPKPKTTTRKRKPWDPNASKVRTQATETTERLAAMLADSDPELAEILREDGASMAECLAQIAKLSPALRKIILLVLGVFLPVRAFGRIARLLAARVGAWQARRAEAWELEQTRLEAEAQGDSGAPER